MMMMMMMMRLPATLELVPLLEVLATLELEVLSTLELVSL